MFFTCWSGECRFHIRGLELQRLHLGREVHKKSSKLDVLDLVEVETGAPRSMKF